MQYQHALSKMLGMGLPDMGSVNFTKVFVFVGDVCYFGPLAKNRPENSRALTESEHIQLLLAHAACYVDWKEDRPGDAATNEAYHNSDFQEPEKEVAIKRVVLQHIGIGNLDTAI
jgi:hypothetical protein